MQIDPYSAISSLGQADASRKTVADNFDTFLQLLTTQLRNQDPTDPLDTNQFTQQLVQYTEVEQAVKQNETMEKLALLTAANAINGAVGYIGQTVSYNGETSELKDGKAAWGFTSKGDATEAVFTVKDAAGNEVYSEKRSIKEGIGSFTWDGRKSDNTTVTSGNFKLSVTAKDAQGGTVSVSSVVSGTVDGVDMSESEPVLVVGGQKVKLSGVVSVFKPVTKDETSS